MLYEWALIIALMGPEPLRIEMGFFQQGECLAMEQTVWKQGVYTVVRGCHLRRKFKESINHGT